MPSRQHVLGQWFGWSCPSTFLKFYLRSLNNSTLGIELLLPSGVLIANPLGTNRPIQGPLAVEGELGDLRKAVGLCNPSPARTGGWIVSV